jgi:small-conductance mechanosensitive channel
VRRASSSAGPPDGDRPITTPAPATPPDVGARLTTFWNDTIAWFQSHSLELIIAIAAGTAIYFVLRAVRGLSERLCRRDEAGTGWPTIIGRVISRTSNLFMIAVAARLVVGYAGAPPSVANTVHFLFTIIAVVQGAIWVREFILGFVQHRTAAGEHEALGSAMGIIRLLVSVAVFVLAGVVILDNLGVNVTGLVAGLGIGGIAIGLAAQGIFADLFAALSILFDRPFRRGDSIAYDQSNGTVEAIGLKSTRIRSVTGEQRVVSNKNLLDKEIRNNTRLDHRRGKFVLGIVYQVAPDKAAALPDLLKELVEAEGLHFVRAGFFNFGASSLDFDLEFDVPGEEFQVFSEARHRLGMAILKRFNEEGIGLAYPTQVSFTAAPDGELVMPYPDVQRVSEVEPEADPKSPRT